MMQLKSAAFSDFKAIAKLHADSWKKHYRGAYSDYFLDNLVDQERLDAWYERMNTPKVNQQVIVATDGDNIVGFACIYTNDDPRFGTLLDNLHVTATRQQSGIGKLLIKEAARRSYEKDEHSKFYLWVLEVNARARRFYEKLGAHNHETLEKTNIDGSTSYVCRYTWEYAKDLI